MSIVKSAKRKGETMLYEVRMRSKEGDRCRCTLVRDTNRGKFVLLRIGAFIEEQFDLENYEFVSIRPVRERDVLMFDVVTLLVVVAFGVAACR